MQKSTKTNPLSPNQIVALNLRRIRSEVRDWTLKETAEKLEHYLGYHLSRQAIHEWEKASEGKKIHRFDADEITALARLFEIPIGVLFGPPSYFKGRVVVSGKPGIPKAKRKRARTEGAAESKSLSRLQMLQLALPQRNEQAQRAAQEVDAKRFTEAAVRAVLRYLKEDPALAERAFVEVLRSLDLSVPSPSLIEILSQWYKRFLSDHDREVETNSTPHGEAKVGCEVLDFMRSRPELERLLRKPTV
jgi:hypothetical protein